MRRGFARSFSAEAGSYKRPAFSRAARAFFSRSFVSRTSLAALLRARPRGGAGLFGRLGLAGRFLQRRFRFPHRFRRDLHPLARLLRVAHRARRFEFLAPRRLLRQSRVTGGRREGLARRRQPFAILCSSLGGFAGVPLDRVDLADFAGGGGAGRTLPPGNAPASISNPRGWSCRVSRPGSSSAGSPRRVVATACLVASVTGWPSSASKASVALSAVSTACSWARLAPRRSGRFPPESRVVRRAQILGPRDEIVVDVAPAPIELVHRPGRYARLLERADGRAVFAATPSRAHCAPRRIRRAAPDTGDRVETPASGRAPLRASRLRPRPRIGNCLRRSVGGVGSLGFQGPPQAGDRAGVRGRLATDFVGHGEWFPIARPHLGLAL